MPTDSYIITTPNRGMLNLFHNNLKAGGYIHIHKGGVLSNIREGCIVT